MKNIEIYHKVILVDTGNQSLLLITNGETSYYLANCPISGDYGDIPKKAEEIFLNKFNGAFPLGINTEEQLLLTEKLWTEALKLVKGDKSGFRNCLDTLLNTLN